MSAPFSTEPIQDFSDLANQFIANACSHSCCNPLTVVVGKKKRLVIDLSRSVNPYVKHDKFKYENLVTLSEMFKAGYWLFTFDIESGYHHTDIHPNSRKFLGFSFVWPDGRVRYFVFNVLPFGLSSACYIFTKMFRPFVRRWREFGQAALMYIDDGISGDARKHVACNNSTLVQSDLRSSGWKPAQSKCYWEPRQIGEWLGLLINTIRMQFQISAKKLDKAFVLINRNLTSFPDVSVLNITKLCGFLQSMSQALGPVVRLFTRNMYACIAACLSWDSVVVASVGVKEELQFWLSNLNSFNGYSISRSFTAQAVIYSDASHTGYGSYLVDIGEHQASGVWSYEDSFKSSTYRELLAVFHSVQTFARFLKGQKLKIFSDNQNVIRILSVGSKIPALNSIAISLFKFSLAHDISFQVQWVPRSQNAKADYLSRLVDADDWYLNPQLFQLLSSLWGPFDIDRMADHNNTQLKRFNSKFWCPGTEAIDCFTQNWSHCNNWVCPPPALLLSVLKHMAFWKASGVLVVPEWKSAPFWPTICPYPPLFASFITGVYYIPRNHDVFIPGPSTLRAYRDNDSVFQGCPKFNVLALRVSFSQGLNNCK